MITKKENIYDHWFKAPDPVSALLLNFCNKKQEIEVRLMGCGLPVLVPYSSIPVKKIRNREKTDGLRASPLCYFQGFEQYFIFKGIIIE